MFTPLSPLRYHPILCALLLLTFAPTQAFAEGSLIEALEDSNFSLSFRYRFEAVDQDNFSEDAEASTLRTRLNVHTGAFHGFSAFLELDDISSIALDDYNSTRNGQLQYPVVADPTGTSVNQAWVDYQGWENNRLILGRQRINLDNQRFIGGVGWRQNEQTYDAFSWNSSLWQPVTIQYGYLNKVHRIFGPENGAPTDTFESDSHYINLAVADLPFGTLVGYGYWIDLENADALSNQTFGLRATGEYEWGEPRLDYQAEFATQDDYGDNPVDYSANYLLLDAGMSVSGWRGGIGFELLEGSANQPGSAFRTPLATLHKFQGWTDQFLATPDDGIEDLYLNLKTSYADINWLFVYHNFEAEASSRDFGSEWGIQASRSFDRYGSVLVKFARFDADDLAQDVDKLWLQYSIGF